MLIIFFILSRAHGVWSLYCLTLQVSAFNAKVEAEQHVDEESSIKWTDTSTEPPIIVGEPVSLAAL